MFNNQLKKNAIRDLKIAVNNYDATVIRVREKTETLFNLRKNTGNNVIQPVENYINQLANSPKEFDKSFAEYKAEFKIFGDIIINFEAESLKVNINSGGSALGGLAAGIGTVTLMPAAAMAIATTFGTASTGTAIASLSGAAATNAALAWLGGGALAAGGGGIVKGTALLALAGPIGIGIGAIGIIGGGLYAASKNKEISQKSNEERKRIETGYLMLKASTVEIDNLISLTYEHQNGILWLLEELKYSAPINYIDFDLESKQKLGALINHINSLTALLNKKVD
mgnify:CR=1 FL=1